MTVINKKGVHEFDNGTAENLSILQDLLKPDKKNTENQKEILKNESQDTHYLKQIARLEIEVEKNKLNNERFSKIVEELISLRGKLREKKIMSFQILFEIYWNPVIYKLKMVEKI